MTSRETTIQTIELRESPVDGGALIDLADKLAASEIGSLAFDETMSELLGVEASMGSTTSLEIALSMFESVLPGWSVSLTFAPEGDTAKSCWWLVEIECPRVRQQTIYGEVLFPREFYSSHSTTPALALCSAILKTKGAGR